MMDVLQQKRNNLETPTRRRTRASAVLGISENNALTPGWTSGNADLFKMPSSPSPVRTRPVTRRSSMYIAAGQKLNSNIPRTSRRTSVLKNDIPTANQRASVKHGSVPQQSAKPQTKPLTRRDGSKVERSEKVSIPSKIAKRPPRTLTGKEKSAPNNKKKMQDIEENIPLAVKEVLNSMENEGVELNIKRGKGWQKRSGDTSGPAAPSLLAKSTPSVVKKKKTASSPLKRKTTKIESASNLNLSGKRKTSKIYLTELKHIENMKQSSNSPQVVDSPSHPKTPKLSAPQFSEEKDSRKTPKAVLKMKSPKGSNTPILPTPQSRRKKSLVKSAVMVNSPKPPKTPTPEIKDENLGEPLIAVMEVKSPRHPKTPRLSVLESKRKKNLGKPSKSMVEIVSPRPPKTPRMAALESRGKENLGKISKSMIELSTPRQPKTPGLTAPECVEEDESKLTQLIERKPMTTPTLTVMSTAEPVEVLSVESSSKRNIRKNIYASPISMEMSENNGSFSVKRKRPISTPVPKSSKKIKVTKASVLSDSPSPIPDCAEERDNSLHEESKIEECEHFPLERKESDVWSYCTIL